MCRRRPPGGSRLWPRRLRLRRQRRPLLQLEFDGLRCGLRWRWRRLLRRLPLGLNLRSDLTCKEELELALTMGLVPARWLLKGVGLVAYLSEVMYSPIPWISQLHLHLIFRRVEHATEIKQECEIVECDLGVLDCVP